MNHKGVFCKVLIILSVFVTGVSAEGTKTLVLGNGEWEPFQSEHLRFNGVVSRIVSESFASQDIATEFIFYPWKRNFELAKRGKLAGTFVWSKTEDRERDFLFSDVVMRDFPVLFFRSDNPPDAWEPGNWTSLKGLRIGATIGYTYLADFASFEEKSLIKVERVASDELNFRKLIMGRIDVYPATLESGYGILNSYFLDEEVAELSYAPLMPPGYEGVGYSLIIGKSYPGAAELIKSFNAGLRYLKEQGLYDRYFEESRAGLYLDE